MTVGRGIDCNRAYYYCRKCGKGLCPWDARVGLTSRCHSPGVERLVTLCGANADSFEKAAELLHEASGILLSESTIERVTEDVGERIAEHYDAGRIFGGKQKWDWYRDANGHTVGYIELDATGVPQQGIQGKKAEGRMAYVGMILNPLPDPKRVFDAAVKPGATMQARYVSGLYPLEEMGPLMRQQGAAVGLDEAQKWIAISDGGSGLEDFLTMNFPRVEAVILDFFHAMEYVSDLAKALYPSDDAKASAQTKSWSSVLREEGGAVLLSVWNEFAWPSQRGLPAVREEVLGYFRNQVHRMDYPSYEANGWYIGSGAIESACKTVVNARLKGTGMRWSEPGSHALCHVRALYRSEKGQWDAFWERNLAF